jgi:hypothetical protein
MSNAGISAATVRGRARSVEWTPQARELGFVSAEWLRSGVPFCDPDFQFGTSRPVASSPGNPEVHILHERETAGRTLSFIGWQKHVGRTLEGPPGNQPDVL